MTNFALRMKKKKKKKIKALNILFSFKKKAYGKFSSHIFFPGREHPHCSLAHSLPFFSWAASDQKEPRPRPPDIAHSNNADFYSCIWLARKTQSHVIHGPDPSPNKSNGKTPADSVVLDRPCSGKRINFKGPSLIHSLFLLPQVILLKIMGPVLRVKDAGLNKRREKLTEKYLGFPLQQSTSTFPKVSSCFCISN